MTIDEKLCKSIALNFKQRIIWIFVRIPSLMFCEEIWIKQGLSYIPLCSLWILYNRKFISMATSCRCNEVSMHFSFSYPNCQFIHDVNISVSAAHATRYNERSLRGVLKDIYSLLQCDFIVCTFSSTVIVHTCRPVWIRSPLSSWNGLFHLWIWTHPLLQIRGLVKTQ